MMHWSVHDVFGAQDYHVADTRWLRRVCLHLFPYEITFNNFVYSLIAPPRTITKTRLGENENGFLHFPALRFIFNVAILQVSGAFHCFLGHR